MNFYDFQIVFQEVPGEISLCFYITGCSIGCEGCHSPFLWNKDKGDELELSLYTSLLEKYQAIASCVLFMGGEWEQGTLIDYLKIAQSHGFKTCLYTGQDWIPRSIANHLDYVKLGPWITEKGGLDQITTNQQFIDLKTKTNINHLFLKPQYHD